MATVNPYLVFNGNCEEAFLFYKSVFGGEFPYVGKFSDMPADENTPTLSEADANRVMHISLPIGEKLINEFGPFVANTHTETTVSGTAMTILRVGSVSSKIAR